MRPLLALLPLLLVACSSAETREDGPPPPPREVVIAIAAQPRLGADATPGGPDPFDAFASAVTAFTTLTGGGAGYNQRRASAIVILGDLFAADDDEMARADLVAAGETFTVPALFVPDPAEDGARASLQRFGYSEDGQPRELKGGGESGERYLRLAALSADRATVLTRSDPQHWLVGVAGAPLLAEDALPEELDLVITPSPDGEARIVDGPVTQVQIPSLLNAPPRFYTLVLTPGSLLLEAWPSSLEEAAPTTPSAELSKPR